LPCNMYFIKNFSLGEFFAAGWKTSCIPWGTVTAH
jgi:hypothetical protein